MRTLVFTVLLVVAIASVSFAQEINFNSNAEGKGLTHSTLQAKFSDNLFYGGEFSASFGSYSQITIAPSVGYKFNNMFSSILKVAYSRAWESDFKDISGSTLGYNQFGGSVTMRFAPVRQAYALLEPAYYSYELPVGKLGINNTIYYDKERREVPFIFLGAGFYQQIANTRAGITGELKVDLLRDKNSPYKEWAPIYSVGMVYGF